MHAMRRPFQSKAAAKALYDDFLRRMITYARWEADAARKGDAFQCSEIEEAIWALGEAAHAFEDNYSPAHTGFQLWPTDPIEHFLREPDSAMPGTGVIEATKGKFGPELDYFLNACSH
jgi:hypothetical protein